MKNHRNLSPVMRSVHNTFGRSSLLWNDVLGAQMNDFRFNSNPWVATAVLSIPLTARWLQQYYRP